MFNLILMTISILLFVYGAANSRQYEYLTDTLDGGDYPLKSLYSVGFALRDKIKVFAIPKKLRASMIKYAAILFGEAYAQYYTDLVWAQFLTLSLLLFPAILLFGSFFGSEAALLFLLIAAVMVYVVWNMSITKMRDTIVRRSRQCVDEFPNAVSKLALLINSGMVLRDAWRLTAQNPKGPLYELMRFSVDLMDNGASDIEAVYRFGIMSDAQEIKKFASTVIQTLEKGSGELADFLLGQAASLLAEKKQDLLQKGEVAAGKLIIPIGIMFAGVMLIVIAAAMQSFSGL